MILDNLIGITLERINPDPAAIARLLEAAQRNITDAELVAQDGHLLLCKLRLF